MSTPPKFSGARESLKPQAHNRWHLPDLGVGIGLRTVHYARILETKPEVDFFEILSENYLDTGGRPLSPSMRPFEACL